MQDKSEENWKVGLQCLKEGNLNAAANRLYYGMFQAVLLYARKITGYEKTDRTVHGDMCDIVKNLGTASYKYGKVYRKLWSLRDIADYQDDPPDRRGIENLLSDCEKIRQNYLKKASAS